MLKIQDLWKSVKDRRRVAAPEKFYLIFSSIIIRLIIDLTLSIVLFDFWVVLDAQVWNRDGSGSGALSTLPNDQTITLRFLFISTHNICHEWESVGQNRREGHGTFAGKNPWVLGTEDDSCGLTNSWAFMKIILVYTDAIRPTSMKYWKHLSKNGQIHPLGFYLGVWCSSILRWHSRPHAHLGATHSNTTDNPITSKKIQFFVIPPQ